MELTKTQKTLHIIFRIIVFITFICSCMAFITFMDFGFSSSDSHVSYAAVLKKALTACNVYYAMLGAGVLSIIFSIICCKCTQVAAAVIRTIFMTIAVGLSFIAFPTYNYIRSYASAYLNNDFFGIYDNIYRYLDSDAFAVSLIMALLFMIIMCVVYFIISITSVVALAKKPMPYYNNQYNAYSYRQNPYMGQGMYQNGQQNGYNMGMNQPGANQPGANGYNMGANYPNGGNVRNGYFQSYGQGFNQGQQPNGNPGMNMQGGYNNFGQNQQPGMNNGHSGGYMNGMYSSNIFNQQNQPVQPQESWKTEANAGNAAQGAAESGQEQPKSQENEKDAGGYVAPSGDMQQDAAANGENGDI